MTANFAPPLPQYSPSSVGNYSDITGIRRATPIDETNYMSQAYSDYLTYNNYAYQEPVVISETVESVQAQPMMNSNNCSGIGGAGMYKYDYNNFYIDDPNLMLAEYPKIYDLNGPPPPPLPPIIDAALPPQVPRLNLDGRLPCAAASKQAVESMYEYNDADRHVVVNRREVFDRGTPGCGEIEPTRVYVKKNPSPPLKQIIHRRVEPEPASLFSNAPFKAAPSVIVRGAGVNMPAKYFPAVNYYPPGTLPPARQAYSQIVHPRPGEMPFNLGGASFN